MAAELSVGIGDMKIGRGDDRITTYALGSCVGITFYDPALKLGALLHIQLPEQGDFDTDTFRYADTGVPETVRELCIMGFAKERAVIKMAGGARMFPGAFSQFGGIGERNIESVKKALAKEGLYPISTDVGGTEARTMSLNLADGDVMVHAAGGGTIHL